MNWRAFWNRLTKDPLPQEVQIFFNGQTVSGERVSGPRSLQNATVWACVTYLGRTVGQLPWRVMRETDGVCTRIPTHPVDRLLSRRPCPEVPPLAWREMLVGWAALHGNGIAEIVQDARGLAAGMYPIHPNRVTFRRNLDTRELEYHVTNELGATTILKPAQVFHVRGFGDGPVGLDVVSYAAESIGWARATETFGSAYFGNGSGEAGFIKTKPGMTKAAKDQLDREIAAKHGTAKNANKWVLLDADMTAEKTSDTPDAAQFIETRQHQVEEICRWFGVPPHKVMHMLHATFSNIEHQSIEVVVDSINPWALRFEQEADYKLFGPVNREGYYTEMDFKGLLRGDFKSRQEGFAVMRANGVLSADEWRSEEGMNPIAGGGGEKYMVPLNMTTLEMLGEPPKPAPTAPTTDLNNAAYVSALSTSILTAANAIVKAKETQ
jgi:HK97 family phage portal protein